MTALFDPHAPAVTPRDAATVILLRDGPSGLELFFVKRHADVRFMGGAYVFPGGKLDEADLDPRVPADLDAAATARRLGESDLPRTRGLHVAAARECLEEAGVLFARETVSPADVAALRLACDVEKKPLYEILPPRAITLRLSALVPFARWVTPQQESRRFDARFFLAAAPDGVLASHDTRETVASDWLAPREALARAERQEIVLVPPTYRTVQVLMRVSTVEQALGLATNLVPQQPRVAFSEDGAAMVLLPDDPAFGSTTLPISSGDLVDSSVQFATRFTYRDGAWKAEVGRR